MGERLSGFGTPGIGVADIGWWSMGEQKLGGGEWSTGMILGNFFPSLSTLGFFMIEYGRAEIGLWSIGEQKLGLPNIIIGFFFFL